MLIRYIVLYGCHYVIYGTEGYGIHKNPSFCRWLVVQVEEEVAEWNLNLLSGL